jgi:mannosyl-3-phosphoglycerate phosphatase
MMVFTDLDGTLIDHDTYSWAAAKPALAALTNIKAAVVLASSKTAAEVSQLRTALGLDHWPAIVENGAGVLPPHVTEVGEGNTYAALRIAINELPKAQRALFRGFGDMTVQDVTETTGLALPDAELAKQRAFSEPGQWLGDEVQKAAFITDLQAKGIIAQQGGRFLTLSFGGNKADQMRRIIETHMPDHTVALGDALNDVQMLALADFGVVVTNPHRPPLPPLDGEAAGRIIRTTDAGPKGWNTAILDLLDRLKLHEDHPHG